MSNIDDELILGMENALAHARSTKPAARETVVPVAIPDRIDVRSIRRKLGFNQRRFAVEFGFSTQSVRNCEQGIRQSEGSARAYLLVIERNPDAVRKALAVA